MANELKFILHAPNVHSGGGELLLQTLFQALKNKPNLCCILDARLGDKSHIPAHAKILWIQPTLTSRLQAEWLLKKHAHAGDRVLCFGALPPLFSLSAKVLVFMQNRNLVHPDALKNFAWGRARVRIFLERCWLRWRKKNVNTFIVQTALMKKLIQTELRLKEKTAVICQPLLPEFPIAPSADSKSFDFIYVASGDAHKNHARLLEAWRILATQNLFPSLALTLDLKKNKSLCEQTENLTQTHHLKITNLGVLPYAELAKNYAQTKALIYPSLSESYGLPLLEAAHYGLDIIASDQDFVHEVVQPMQTFNPLDAASIACAVMRHLHIKNQIKISADAQAFIQTFA